MIFLLIFIFVCVIIGIALGGCSNRKIEFNRESAFQKALSGTGFPIKKEKVKKSKGIYIYSYGTEENNNNTNNFGPSDINFDLPIKFK